MAVRFDATGEHYIRTTGGFLTTTAFTIAVWAIVDVDRNASTCIWGYRGATPQSYIYLYNPSGDGTTQAFEVMGTDGIEQTLVGPNMTVGTWYFLACGRTGTGASQTFFGSGTPGSALTWATGTISKVYGTLDEETIGSNGYDLAGGWFNGRVAALKIWSVGLTQDQLETERRYVVPQNPGGLFEWRPFFQGSNATAALADWSGNGRTLSGGTASVTADGPPIAWDSIPIRSGWRAAAAPAGRTTRNTLASPLGMGLGMGLWTHGA